MIPRTRHLGMPLLGVAILLITGFGLAAVGCGSDDDPAPTTTGSVAGTVTEPQSGSPVVGATVTIDPVTAKMSASTTTDTNGDYSFSGVEAGDYTLTVDASAVVVDPGDNTLVYAGFSTVITVRAGQTAETDVFSPVVDTDNQANVQDGVATVLSPDGFPNFQLDADADAVTFPDGSTEGTLNIVELRYDQGPASLGAGVATSFMFQIIPQGTAFDPAATVQLPDRDDLATGTVLDLFSYDSASGAWASDGTVTSDGSGALAADSGTGIASASTHFTACNHTVVGRVVDDQKAPVEGALVRLHATVRPFGDLPGPPVELVGKTATTDANGDFSISGVQACRVSFSATLDGPGGFGVVQPGPGVAPNPAGDTPLGTRTMEVVTQTTFNVAGTVRFTDGSPAPFVPVGWAFPNENKARSISTDENGNYAYQLTLDPGLMLIMWASSQFGSGETPFTVPPLADTGTTLTIDIQICDDVDGPCGSWGTWSLSGSTMSLTFNEVECGEVLTQSMDIQVLDLDGGDLTIGFDDDGKPVTDVLSRVSGSGPTGVSSANLPGVYLIDDKVEPEIAVIYANGQIVVFRGYPNALGTYTDNGTTVTVNFDGISDDLDYSRSGSTLTLTPPDSEEAEVYEECPNGFDGGGLVNLWSLDDPKGGSATLVFYNGEFARVSQFSPFKAWPSAR